jgi:Predicted nucleotidyltransferases
MITTKKYDQDLCIKNDILSTIAYFDIFTYPLKKREIWLFLPNVYDQSEFEIALQLLVNNSTVYVLGEFYSLQNNYAIANRRIIGNERAKELIAIAEKVAAFLSKFPYVRGVAVSGSLSKNFADENSDIDLFIIAAKNRLWIARTILHCFKKFTFLVRKQHFFCMNYFIEQDHLEIAEKNIYTATEIATLLPLQGAIAFDKFYAVNRWTNTFLPNKYLRVSTAKKIESPLVKWIVEKLLNNFIGNVIEDMFMRMTANRWALKTKKRKLNSHGIIMGMSAAKYCAKPIPLNFQNKFLDMYERKVFELLHKRIVKMKPVP